MIKYLEQHYIDQRKYNDCVRQDKSALFYAYAWYLSAVCERWDLLVLNDYDAVWPVPVRYKWGVKYCYQPVAVQQLGPYAKRPLSDEEWELFLEAFYASFRFANISLNENQFTELNDQKMSMEQQPNYVLNLNRPYRDIYEGYSTNLKRNLRRSEKEGLQLFNNDGPDEILELFKTHKAGELKLQEHFFRDFKKVLYQCIHMGLANVYTVYGGPNTLLAGAFFVKHQGRAVFLFSAVSPYGRSVNAMPFLINEFIIYNSQKMDLLDFEGSKQSGLARFYKSFGAENKPYPRLHVNRLPKLISWLK